MALPENRWAGIFAPTPMRVLGDSITMVLGDRVARPTNDYAQIDASLLPFLAWQTQALGYDPDGTDAQHREALVQARRLHTLVGTREAFNLLMTVLQTQGEVILCGDYDSAGNPVARLTQEPLIPRGTHSRHSANPLEEDTTRDAEGRPTPNVNPRFVWDNLVYHKFVRIEIVLPPGRRNDEAFVNNVVDVAHRVLPYTLQVAHVLVLTPLTVAVHLHQRHFAYNQTWVFPNGEVYN